MALAAEASGYFATAVSYPLVDGKVMTLSSKGTDAAGKPTESTLVFDKS